MESRAKSIGPIARCAKQTTATPISALIHQAHSRPEGRAFIFHQEDWTYRGLADESERVAHGLVANGVRVGDRVALHMMNRPEMLVAYYACFRLGAIAAPLRTAFKFAELAPLLQRLRPALYIGEADLYRNVAEVDADIIPRQSRFIVDAAGEKDGVRPWKSLSRQTEQTDLPTSPSYEPAVLINTSGTTGQPKFVMHTPDTLAATTDLLCRHLGLAAAT
jgi:long-chain acyl-CoA synthetase